jgi:inner membrane protease ATP23
MEAMPMMIQVVICSNHVMLQDEVDVALTHELLHAYDHCRAANLDWTNCEHHACSEIRAANLSGDCHWKRELNRGNFNIQGQHQVFFFTLDLLPLTSLLLQDELQFS